MDLLSALSSFFIASIYILIIVLSYQSIKASQARMKVTQKIIDEMRERKRSKDISTETIKE